MPDPFLRDPFSSLSHYVASGFAVLLTAVMWRLTRGDPGRRASVTIFGVTMAVLYAASGTFHALKLPREELRVYQKIDQSGIFCFIAGTYTPIMAMLLRGWWRIALLFGVWFLAGLGVSCLWVFTSVPYSVLIGLYIGLGWIGWVGAVHYYRATGFRGMAWVGGGALCYTFGGLCERLKWPTLWPGVIQRTRSCTWPSWPGRRATWLTS